MFTPHQTFVFEFLRQPPRNDVDRARDADWSRELRQRSADIRVQLVLYRFSTSPSRTVALRSATPAERNTNHVVFVPVCLVRNLAATGVTVVVSP